MHKTRPPYKTGTPKKYRLTDEYKIIQHPRWSGREVVFHRIQALRDIPEHNVIAGNLGGWVEHEGNLSQFGSAWVSENGAVFDGAVCMVGAHVTGNAWQYEFCVSRGKATLDGYAQQCGTSQISGNSYVGGSVTVAGDAYVWGEYRNNDEGVQLNTGAHGYVVNELTGERQNHVLQYS